MKSNVNLCVTLKTHLFSSVLLKLNRPYTGVLRRNGLDHFDFVETLRICSCKRNPHVFSGHYITIVGIEGDEVLYKDSNQWRGRKEPPNPNDLLVDTTF